MYGGEYKTSLDDKGRITMPAKMRQIMEVLKHTDWYMTRGFDGCIALYPHPEWEKIRAQVGRFSPLDPRALDFRRNFYSSVSEVRVDRQGRVPVPVPLREYAGFGHKDELVVIGVGEYVEVWNAEAWRAYQGGTAGNLKSTAAQMCRAENEANPSTQQGERTP